MDDCSIIIVAAANSSVVLRLEELRLVHVTSAACLAFDLSRASCDCIQVNFYTQENMSVTGQTNPPVNVYYVGAPWLISYSELIIDFTTYDFNSESALTPVDVLCSR